MSLNRGLLAAAFLTLFAAVVVLAAPAALWAETQHEKHINMSAKLVREMQKQSDADSLAGTVKSARGVAIFPSVIQAGLGIGGMSGEGVVFVREGAGWRGPSFASIVGGSFGLQIGVKEVGLVLVITNEAGLQAFTGGNSFKLGGDVSVAAGPVGRDAQAATDSRAAASIYSYSMSRGLFAGLALSGSTINVNGDANKAYWGKATNAKTALSRKADGPKVKTLVSELNKLSKLAK
ncbi:MAG: lipid-binding SYLF domain-containing protein [Synergistaceae bacterium]|jgi:lipid-binding SYLF domain-containing protein|nr:lipid-binding SYLF domain-containing protein [Synergistaceae bacterium]